MEKGRRKGKERDRESERVGEWEGGKEETVILGLKTQTYFSLGKPRSKMSELG